MAMRAVYRKDAPPGPAGRWLIENLKGRAPRLSHASGDALGAKADRGVRKPRAK
jgi:hypothetical protein